MTSRHDMRANQSADALRKIGAVTSVPTSSAEIDAAMMRAIRSCLAEDRPIELRDFRKVLVPEDQIAPRFNRLLAEVRAERRRGR
jgi:hypothetical protein